MASLWPPDDVRSLALGLLLFNGDLTRVGTLLPHRTVS